VIKATASDAKKHAAASFSSDSSALYPRRVNLHDALAVRLGGRNKISGIVATVFGASGFIGRYVVGEIGTIGSQVIIPYRGDGENIRHLKLAGDLGQIVPIPVDLWNDEALERSVARSNVVVNLVGARNETLNYSYHDSNVKTTHRIAKMAAAAGVEKFVQISCLGADKNSLSKWIASKAESEEVARDFFPNATILRLGPVYGEEDTFLNNLAESMRYSFIIPVLNNGSNLVQPVFVGDVATAVMQSIILPEAEGKTYHIGGDKVISYKELIDLVGEMIFRRDNTLDVPVEVAKFIGRMSDKFLSARRRRFTEDSVEQLLVDQVVPEDALTLRDLNVKVTDFDLEASSLLLAHRGARGNTQARRVTHMLGDVRHPELLDTGR